jgi:hypothetical protein
MSRAKTMRKNEKADWNASVVHRNSKVLIEKILIFIK